MIEQLTEQQVAKFPEYVKKWTEIGLSTKQQTQEQAEKDMAGLYQHILKAKVPTVKLLKSPKECWREVQMSLLTPEEKEEVAKNPSVLDENFIYPYFDGQFWAGWFSFYDYMETELGIKFTNKVEYDAFKACVKYNLIYPLDNICVVCQPPTIIKKNASGLHCVDGPALSYGGENEIYALNGVTMTKEQVMTPAHKISAQEVLKESNVERRRELLRKVGIERLLNDLPHKLLDKRDNYELYSVELSDQIRDAKYLKMLNPSIKVFHMEGVAPEITTVDAALKWRNQNLFINAEKLT